MGLVTRLSWRNLVRQKKRNLFLGICIGFGMMILVVANSFSHGMVDVLINEVVSYAFGHLVVDGTQGNSYFTMIRDKERIVKIIEENIKPEDLLEINENLGMMGRAVGNGEADNVVVVGVTIEEDEKYFFNDFFTLLDGNFDDYFSTDYEYPVIVSSAMAKSLNVKVHDTIKIRIPMVTGQIQAAKLTVIAIADASNTFMNMVLFMQGYRVKELLGYKPWESASLQVTLRDPLKTAKYYADILHEKLKPGVICVAGKIGRADCQLVAFKHHDQAKEALRAEVTIVAGDPEKAWEKRGVMVSKALAQKLGLKAGDKFNYSYQTKFRGIYEEEFTVDAIYDSRTKLGADVLLVNEERIHDILNTYLPAEFQEFLAEDDPLYTALATEWKLLRRSKDSQELEKLYKNERKNKSTQSRLNIITMYEGASDILKLEAVLNLLTMNAVLILFFIILIGVVNTLRMTIKERTREIGTIRAIGMQKRDVRNVFIMETLFLTALSCIAGVTLGIVVIKVLGAFTFNSTGALSIILKDGRLVFKLAPLSILGNFLLILVIACVTAYFPARHAANLSAVEALRHYE
ncbi:MAG TPA: FtsX-like permease family protein [Firmicutes bacterium]|nr:FtsX-like permease family protein [Bacillota bacterium]